MRCTRERRTWIRAALVTVAIGTAAASAHAVERFVVEQAIVVDEQGGGGPTQDYLDMTVVCAWNRAHAAVTFGSFDAGVELGGSLRDRRGSAYGLLLRRRTTGQVENTSVEIETGQKLGRVVLGAGVRGFWPDRPSGPNLLLIPSVAVDVYTGGHSFLSLRSSLDPRPGTGAVFRFLSRISDGARQLDLTLTPRTDGACGWGVRGRYRVFVAGFGHEPDFDFTNIDRQIWYLGFEYDLRP